MARVVWQCTRVKSRDVQLLLLLSGSFFCVYVCVGGAYLYGHVVTQSQPDHIFHEGMFY